MENNNEILLALIELAKVQPGLFERKDKMAVVEENPFLRLAIAEVAMRVRMVPKDLIRRVMYNE